MWQPRRVSSNPARRPRALGRCCGAAPVVDDHGIDIRQTRLPIKVHQDGAALLKCAQEIQVRPGRAIDNTGNFPTEQKPKSRFFFGAIFVCIADQEGVTVGPGFVFDSLDESGKEKISDIGDNDADGSGLLSAKGTPRSIGCIVVAMDDGQDALASEWSNIFWS